MSASNTPGAELITDGPEASPPLALSGDLEIGRDPESPEAGRSRKPFIAPKFEEFGKGKRASCFSSLT